MNNIVKFDVFLTVHHSIHLFHVTNLIFPSTCQPALNLHTVRPFTEVRQSINNV